MLLLLTLRGLTGDMLKKEFAMEAKISQLLVPSIGQGPEIPDPTIPRLQLFFLRLSIDAFCLVNAHVF